MSFLSFVIGNVVLMMISIISLAEVISMVCIVRLVVVCADDGFCFAELLWCFGKVLSGHQRFHLDEKGPLNDMYCVAGCGECDRYGNCLSTQINTLGFVKDF